MRARELTHLLLRLFEISLHFLQSLLDEDTLLMRRRGAGVVYQEIELVEVTLREIARAARIGIFDGDGDNAALLVVGNRGDVRKMLRCIHPITLVICALQIEAVDEMTCDCAAAQQIHEERSSIVPSQKTSRETAESAAADPAKSASCQRGNHGGGHTGVAGRHDLC